MSLVSALCNDIAQRVLTANKRNQKSKLAAFLDGMSLPNGPVMDFGCGTALFAPLFLKRGMDYTGYDVDPALLRYASRLYPAATFTTDIDALAKEPSFSLILANCCFHHIGPSDLEEVLKTLRSMLLPGGVLLVIDILATPDSHFLHKLFMKLEKGRYVRDEQSLKRIVERTLTVSRIHRYRDVLFGFSWAACPIGNEMIALECRL